MIHERITGGQYVVGLATAHSELASKSHVEGCWSRYLHNSTHMCYSLRGRESLETIVHASLVTLTKW